LALAAVARAEEVGWVSALEGTAERQRAGAWADLAAGQALELGDHVRTGQASKVKLLLRDDSVLTLAERSEMVLDEQVVGAAPSSSFSLLLGKMRAVVTDRYGATGAKFEVKSPTAIAGVRGTSFVAEYDRDRDETQVVGIEHVTAVRSLADATGAKEVRLGPGQATTVRRGSTPTLPAKLPAAAVQGLVGATTVREGTSRSGGPKAVADPRLPSGAGSRDGSPEGRVIDQPFGGIGKKDVQPPPPPIR
jgi:hypothetical protein